MPGPITCNTSPAPLPCVDSEPEEALATPTTIGPPPDPATARRLEQAAADARMQQLADGGLSTRRAASAPGKLPAMTTVQPGLRKEYEAMVAARSHEKPVEHDAVGQALPTLGLSIWQGAAHGAYGILKHVVEHVVLDAAAHHVEEKLHEHEAHERLEKESRDVQPAPRPTFGIRG